MAELMKGSTSSTSELKCTYTCKDVATCNFTLEIELLESFIARCYDYQDSISVVPFLRLQSNLGIRDTQGTVKNWPQFQGGLISQVNLCVPNTPRD